ncbi:MAG: dTDP-4-dehydrorhamnose 3,5-epimerase [Eubacteriales bacterium]
MGKFSFNKTEIEGLWIIEPTVFGDDRGYFMETYNHKEFSDAGLDMTFVQDNESKSKKGVLRGLHFQKEHPQGKLVRVVEGQIFDVAVDLRKESISFGKWHGMMLSGKNKKQLYIPEGFAHGFLVISEEAKITYKCTNIYDPNDECGIKWDDEDINIDWPIEDIGKIILSEKDMKLKQFNYYSEEAE